MKLSPTFRKISFLTAATLMFAIGCSSDEVKEDVAAEQSAGAVVDTVTLEETTFVEYIDLTGVTEPIRSATLSPEVAGRITTYNLTEGARSEERRVGKEWWLRV